MNRIYISGKISGLEDRNIPKFKAAETLLLNLGFEVVNPHNILPFDPERSWEEYMKADIKELCECDAIFLLDDWAESNGARTELFIAIKLGLKVYCENFEYETEAPEITRRSLGIFEPKISIPVVLGAMLIKEGIIHNVVDHINCDK